MGEMEDMGLARLTHHGYLYAFHEDGGKNAWVNLRWLADVIRAYEAGDFRLSNPEPEDEYAAKVELDILRPSVEQVNRERDERFARQRRS